MGKIVGKENGVCPYCLIYKEMRRESEMRNRTQSILWILAVVLLAGTVTAPAGASDAPRMPKEELRAKLGSPDIVIIDVRAQTDWLLTKQKIKGAVRENPRQPEKWIDRYSKDKTIVLYCA